LIEERKTSPLRGEEVRIKSFYARRNHFEVRREGKAKQNPGEANPGKKEGRKMNERKKKAS